MLSCLQSLATPCLLLDRSRLERNIDRMQRRMAAFGVRLRPHLKTAKSARIARMLLGSGDGLTVSTLREAEYFFEHGFRDILYAVGVVPARLERAAALVRRGARLSLLTDDPAAARSLAAEAVRRAVDFPVYLEIDSGQGRAGVAPDSERLLEVAAIIAGAPRLRLEGVLTHAGHAYHCADPESLNAVARTERDSVVTAARRLRAAGLPCAVVSAGSTPTAIAAHDLAGVTEMRPGVFVFFDLTQLGIGVCTRDDLALSVLATVIGHHPGRGHLVLDAGSLALSQDVGANELRPGTGYGELCDATTLSPLGLHVAAVNQEHGMAPVNSPADFTRLPVGSRVRILPNHACITAAGYPAYHVLGGDDEVEVWERVNGW